MSPAEQSHGADAVAELAVLRPPVSNGDDPRVRHAPSRNVRAWQETIVGDKGGRKDKAKSKHQHDTKQKEEHKRKEEKARPKSE